MQKLDDIIIFSELGAFIHEPVKIYSDGMRARLGFSVAVQLEPDIILIDEALAVGDEAFREKSAAVMRAKIQSNQTVVLVSHSGAQVKDLCSRVVWLENGITQMEGDPEIVVSAYEDYILQNTYASSSV